MDVWKETPAAVNRSRFPFAAKTECSPADRSRARDVNQTDLIRLGFLLAAKGHEHTVLRARTERAHDGALLVVIHIG